MEKIIANNKLIAEFMGMEVIYDGISYFFYYTDKKGIERVTQINNLYNDSWEWMMPVIEKINSFQAKYVGSGVSLHHRNCLLGYHASSNGSHVYEKSFDTYKNDQTKTLLENTFDAIVEFINWYNKNK